MILKVNDTAYVVHFFHEAIKPISSYKGKDTYPIVPGTRDARATHRTECTIHVLPCANKTRPCNTPNAFYGMTFCSVLDNFDRAKGRKTAFGCAVSQYPKAIRTALWHEYLVATAATPTHKQEKINREIIAFYKDDTQAPEKPTDDGEVAI